ncbi:MAG: four helix bundle protein [Kosmotoga sp.]|nr:MAG: four helix bundle protein [Kosmotoga sp.]
MAFEFRKLDVWKQSMEFVRDVYKITKRFPNDEKFALVDQLRRAAISIPSNISEGSSRKSSRDFSHFLNISIGSLNEVVTQLGIAQMLEYINEKEFQQLEMKASRIHMMLLKLRSSINNRHKQTKRPIPGK